MSLRLDITNFRNIRELHLDDPGKLSVIVGHNEAGKSGLVNAIKFAFCGEAYGFRGKSITPLITHGETRLSVNVKIGPHFASRTTSGGDAVKTLADRLGVQVDVLPLLFDASMCGDGGNKHLQAFLSGSSAAKFDPLVHFNENALVRSCIEKARGAGRLTTKQTVQYCTEMRAGCRAPDPVTMPLPDRPDAARRGAADAALERASAALADTRARGAQAADLGRSLAALAMYLTSKAQYDALLTSQPGDAISGLRSSLTRMLGINPATLTAMGSLMPATEAGLAAAAALEAAHTQVQAALADARAVLGANPPPPSLPPAPVCPPNATELLAKLEAAGQLDLEALRTSCAAMAAREAGLLTEIAASVAAVAANQAARDTTVRAAALWSAYDTALPTYDHAVVEAKSRWDMWDHAAKAIESAESEFQAASGDVFGKLVTDMAAPLLNGRTITVSPTEGIKLGLDPIAACSTATRWRIEVAVQAAIARMLKSPILVVDGADILDARNRKAFTAFLLQLIVPHFEHVVLTMTSAHDDLATETQFPAGDATKWILVTGTITKA